jgi:hypothetical protein
MPEKSQAQIAEDALKALQAATAPLAKAAVDEAQAALDEAKKYDAQVTEALTKAAPPEQDADGDYDGDTKKPKTQVGDGDGDEDCDEAAAKAADLLDLSKTAHEVVKAYMLNAVDETAKAENSPWSNFTKTAKDYYSSLSQTLQQCIDARRKSMTTLTEVVAKADNDNRKKSTGILIAAHETLAKHAEAGVEMCKGMIDAAVWPRQEIVLDPPMTCDTIKKGYMSIASKDDLMRAVAEYKNVDPGDQPPVYAHIFNAAAALKTALPEGWHKPVTLPSEHSASTGSDQTARWKNISEADKAAAMKKGMTIVGPSAGLLATIRAIGASQLLERMAIVSKDDPNIGALKEWMGKGDQLLVSIIGNEAEAIRILDIPTFPAAQALIKADHWTDVAAKAVIDSLSDEMPAEQRAIRKDVSERLAASGEVFKKAELPQQQTEGLVEKAELEKVVEERDALNGRLTKFTEALVPLTRNAQSQRDEIKKMAAENAALKAKITELETKPMPSKGRVGAGGKVEKADDGGSGTGTEVTPGSAKDLLTKAGTLPPGARGTALIEAAHRFRAEEEGDEAA